MDTSSSNPKRILILGGGFGGLYTALHLQKKLARNPDVEITLVNRENFFLFTPMLHEVAASDLDLTHIVNPVRKLLRRVKFFDGEIKSIDLNQVLSISLTNSMVSKARAKRILRVVERELLTLRGLRTLSPNDSRYVGRYEGDLGVATALIV